MQSPEFDPQQGKNLALYKQYMFTGGNLEKKYKEGSHLLPHHPQPTTVLGVFPYIICVGSQYELFYNPSLLLGFLSLSIQPALSVKCACTEEEGWVGVAELSNRSSAPTSSFLL